MCLIEIFFIKGVFFKSLPCTHGKCSQKTEMKKSQFLPPRAHFSAGAWGGGLGQWAGAGGTGPCPRGQGQSRSRAPALSTGIASKGGDSEASPETATV